MERPRPTEEVRRMRIGYFLSSEEYGPRELVRQARLAEQAGFDGLWISDHFHPWNEAQGHSPFVWSVIGAIAQAAPSMHVTTAVTCPTVRLHPAIVAQAAATSAVLLDGRFTLGVGTGEALNEHILGDPWPRHAERLEMLEEAIGLIRTLWQGGMHSHRGTHYRVENARIYDLPDEPIEIIVSAFESRAIAFAARAGDGFCTVTPDAGAVRAFRSGGGASKTVAGGLKVCWDEDEATARTTAHRLWANESLPGELAQVLPMPAHFEQASELVSPELVAESIPCGPEAEAHLDAVREYEQAGFDEVYISQIGGAPDGFFELYADEVVPRFGSAKHAASAAGAPA